MSEATSGVADLTSIGVPCEREIGVPCKREICVPCEREVGVPWEREGLLWEGIAGLEVVEEVARAEEGLWVAIVGSTKHL